MPLTAPVFAPGVEELRQTLRGSHVLRRRQTRGGLFVRCSRGTARHQVTTPDGGSARCSTRSISSPLSPAALSPRQYALHVSRPSSYAPRFLNHDTEKDLWRKVLAPVNWSRLAKPLVSRSDLEVEYFDEELFRERACTTSPRARHASSCLHGPGAPNRFHCANSSMACVDEDGMVARAVFSSALRRSLRTAGHAEPLPGAAGLESARRSPGSRARRLSTTSIAAGAPTPAVITST